MILQNIPRDLCVCVSRRHRSGAASPTAGQGARPGTSNNARLYKCTLRQASAAPPQRCGGEQQHPTVTLAGSFLQLRQRINVTKCACAQISSSWHQASGKDDNYKGETREDDHTSRHVWSRHFSGAHKSLQQGAQPCGGRVPSRRIPYFFYTRGT